MICQGKAARGPARGTAPRPVCKGARTEVPLSPPLPVKVSVSLKAADLAAQNSSVIASVRWTRPSGQTNANHHHHDRHHRHHRHQGCRVRQMLTIIATVIAIVMIVMIAIVIVITIIIVIIAIIVTIIILILKAPHRTASHRP